MFAFSSRPVSWVGPGSATPDPARWTRLKAEVRAEHDRRVWLSNENLSDEPEDVLHAIVEATGGTPFVVLTMRGLPAQLASAWQQYLKSGVGTSFGTWLERVIGDTPNPSTTPSFAARSALGEVVDKWVRVVGKDNLVVIVLDAEDRTLVPRTFERLLGLPEGNLEEDALAGHHSNRSLSAPEAELLRRVNRVIRERGDVSWVDYERFVREGFVDALLCRRTPGPDELRVVPPRWAVDAAVTRAHREIERIATSGVRVVGTLDDLAAPVPSVDRARSPQTIPVDAAAEALLAVLSVGLGRGNDFGTSAPDTAPRSPEARRASIEDVPASMLAQSLAQRLGRRLRRQLTSALPNHGRRRGQ